jgi:phosphoglycolate phosphatase
LRVHERYCIASDQEIEDCLFLRRKKVNTLGAVIFDLDGTLVDSREDIVASINHGLHAVGAVSCQTAEIYPLIGRPLSEMFSRLLPASLVNSVDDATIAFRKYYFDHCADASRLYPGVVECLDELKKYTLAIATTKQTFMAVEVARLLGFTDRFALIQGSDGIPHKPDPALLYLVADKLAVEPEKCLMVGDTTYDIDAGRAAGMRTCGVTYGFGNRDDLVGSAPTVMLDSLSDLGEWIVSEKL